MHWQGVDTWDCIRLQTYSNCINMINYLSIKHYEKKSVSTIVRGTPKSRSQSGMLCEPQEPVGKDNMSDRFFNTLFEKDFAFFKVSVSFLKKNKPAQLFTIVMNHFLRLNIRTAIRLFRP